MDNYPKKRPKVSEVREWEKIHDGYITGHSDTVIGEIEIYKAHPFSDYYKVSIKMKNLKRSNRLFYGELAHQKMSHYLEPFGVTGLYQGSYF